MPRRRRYPHRREGFTLIEAAIAVMVVGLGIVSLVHAMGAGTRVNATGRDITTATFLAQEVREWTLGLPFSDPDPGDADNPPGPDGSDPHMFVDDLDDLMSTTFSPPRDGQGYVIDGMDDWSQLIGMGWRDPDSLTTTVPAGTSDVVNVIVLICHKQEIVLITSWLVTRRTQ